MKKIVPILLLIIVCINHLNIIDAAMKVSAIYKKQQSQANKNFPADEEIEKENKGKEKIEEPEKYYDKDHFIVIANFQLSDKDKFLCFSTALNAHPFKDDDIQPPKAA